MKFYRFCLLCHVRFAKSIILNSRNLAQRKFTETKEQLKKGIIIIYWVTNNNHFFGEPQLDILDTFRRQFI